MSNCRLCKMADAMEMTLISFLGPALRCEWWLTSWQQALITTTVFCGMMLSSTMWGNVSDAHGRKMVNSGGICWFVANLVTLYAEFLPNSQRARCVVFIEVFWALGAAFETLLAMLIMSHLSWRWLLCVSVLPGIIFLIFLWWFPESPRFLIATGQPGMALATLQKVAKENGSTLSVKALAVPKTEVLFKLLYCSLFEQASIIAISSRGGFLRLFSSELRCTTVLLWFIWVSCAFCYYGIVLFTAELFQSGSECHGGIGETMPEVSCPLECKRLTTQDYTDIFWTTLSEFPGLVITAVLMEYFGRKMTMAIEFIVYTACAFLLFICLDRTATTVIIFIARAFISGAFQAVFVYTPEVYPTISRSVGLGSCSAMSRVGALTTPFVAQVLAKTHVNLTIAVYALFGLLTSVAVLLLPIETKGRAMTVKNSQTQLLSKIFKSFYL
ncbi:unnamed protein product [Soboliphyme baturini]|uniref:MFS domain-containing protein n=1 Tax=Soboliphyme baturini TaxID=241478 RepID=A0A183IKD3_9BILA|nr:unnamed protein product [Soboliphyme baturini]